MRSNFELADALGLPGKDPLQPPKAALPQKKQPPTFWKAFGSALKQKFALAGSLTDDGRALFIAEPGQVGVPAGRPFPREVTKYELFIKADTMQAQNYPTFTLKGNSYFDFLNSYLRNAGTDQARDPAVLNARSALEAATRTKDAAWEAGRKRYQQDSSGPAADTPGTGTLVDFLEHDEAYLSAWNLEKDTANVLHTLRPPQMEALSEKLEMLRLADKRLEFERGNNMPVITISEDWVARVQRLLAGTDDKGLVHPAWIYYRPAYSLPSYDTDAASWASAAVGPLERDGPYMIPLAGIWDRDWADLGHPLLDSAKPAEKLTDQQKNILSSLTVNLTYLQKPISYQVNAGDWAVHDFRNFDLPSTAPEWLSAKVCRTSKMIFAWGIEIEIIIPDLSVVNGLDVSGRPSQGDTVSEAALRNLTLTALDLPLKPEASASNKLVFQSVARPVPLLLGVLADVV